MVLKTYKEIAKYNFISHGMYYGFIISDPNNNFK